MLCKFKQPFEACVRLPFITTIKSIVVLVLAVASVAGHGRGSCNADCGLDLKYVQTLKLPFLSGVRLVDPQTQAG